MPHAWKECLDGVKMQSGHRDDVQCRMGTGRGLRGQGGDLGADMVHGEVQGGDLGCRAESLGAWKGPGCRTDAGKGPPFPGSKSRTYQVVVGEYDMSAGEGPEQRIPVNSDDIFVHPKWLSFCAACG